MADRSKRKWLVGGIVLAVFLIFILERWGIFMRSYTAESHYDEGVVVDATKFVTSGEYYPKSVIRGMDPGFRRGGG